MELAEALAKANKLDIGQAKKFSLISYLKRLYESKTKLDIPIDLVKLSKLSRVDLIGKLRN